MTTQQATSNMQQGRSGSEVGFRGLLAWQAAQELASLVYRSLKALPPSEAWLRSQATRAALSVSANIAEGYGRSSQADYLRFLEIANGSLYELENYLYFLAKEGLLGAADLAAIEEVRIRTGNLLHGLIRGTREKAKSAWNRGGVAVERPKAGA